MDLIDVFWTERDALYRHACKILGNPQDAEDAVHDCFLRLSPRDKAPPEAMHPRAWLFRVLRNICIDRIRARDKASNPQHHDAIAARLHTDGVQAMTAEHEVIMSDTLRRVQDGIRELPGEDAETLTLAVVEGLSYAEIAFATNVPIGTVRSRLHRARRVLRDLLAVDPTVLSEPGN